MTLTVAEVATVAWDYTMADLEAFARKAARLANAPVMSREDAADTAWHGIVEALYTATEKPTPHQLIGAGVTIVQRERRDWYRHHGVDVDHPGRGCGCVIILSDRESTADHPLRCDDSAE